MLRRDLKDTLTFTTDVVVAATMVVAEGEIVVALVRVAVVDTVAGRLVTVADAVVEGFGPAVKTLF